jgi:phosphoglycerate dehydrogenase-like enzyme
MASLNAISVAEYSLGVIILSLKHFWKYSCAMQREPQYRYRDDKMPGGYRSTVGLIGLGEIGKHVARLLHHLDILVLAHDPYCHEKEAAELGVKLVSFNDIFSRSDVVSLHIPLLAETKGIVRGEHFSLMRDGASFINTSRGAIVHEVEMIEVLKKRSDITAVLDVTWPEPPETGSALFNLHNVILTPHLAGAVGRECRRLGDGILSELYRHLSGQKLMYAVTRAKVEAGT